MSDGFHSHLQVWIRFPVYIGCWREAKMDKLFENVFFFFVLQIKYGSGHKHYLADESVLHHFGKCRRAVNFWWPYRIS